jgi:biopolymer transport protein ExbB
MIKGTQLARLPGIDHSLASRLEQATKSGTANATNQTRIKDHVTKISNDLQCAQRKLVQIALSTPVSQQRDDLLVAFLMEHKHRIERFMGIVATSAAIAPLLGLLGTVSGMINTFKMMTIFGSGDASTVSGGISEALVTTELGLIVAIPSLIISALLSRKTKSYSHKLESLAIKLSKVKFAV